MPLSLISSWTSTSRQRLPLIAYSLAPSRNISRLIVTSAYSIGSAPSVLSIVSVTSARPSGGLPGVPAKMTSSIFPPRSALAPCSPSTQAIASTTLLLPEPFGPTTQVMPGSKRSVVGGREGLEALQREALEVHGVPSTGPTLAAPRARRRPAPAGTGLSRGCGLAEGGLVDARLVEREQAQVVVGDRDAALRRAASSASSSATRPRSRRTSATSRRSWDDRRARTGPWP